MFPLAILHYSILYDTSGKEHWKCSVWKWFQMFPRLWQGYRLVSKMAIFISMSCRDICAKFYRSADPARVRRTENALRGQRRHWLVPREALPRCHRADEQDCLPEQTPPSQELWNLVSIKKVPREPETHLELFHREPIWGTWLALYSTFKITTFH